MSTEVKDVRERLKVTEEELKNLELRSSDVRYLLSKVPGHVMRFGSAYLFAVVVLVIIVALFVRYPLIVEVDALVVSSPPVVSIATPIEGDLTLSSNDKDRVTKGQQLGYLKVARKVDSSVVLYAPVGGVIAFDEHWSKTQYVNASIPILKIIQSTSTFHWELKIPASAMSKVRVGQSIVITPDTSAGRYGSLHGKIIAISPMQKDGCYEGSVDLPPLNEEHLFTIYNTTGKARITLEELSVLSLVFRRFQKDQ